MQKNDGKTQQRNFSKVIESVSDRMESWASLHLLPKSGVIIPQSKPLGESHRLLNAFLLVITLGLCVLAQPLQSCLTLCDPADYSPQGSSLHGILQARILECVAMPSSRGSSWPRDWICIACGSLPLSHWGSPALARVVSCLWSVIDTFLCRLCTLSRDILVSLMKKQDWELGFFVLKEQ